MKKIKLFTKAVETAFGAVVVLYALLLVRLDSDLPYIRYAMALGMVIMAAGVLGFFVKKPVLRRRMLRVVSMKQPTEIPS